MVYLIILTILFAILAIYAFISRQKVNTKVQAENAVLLEKNQTLSNQCDFLCTKIDHYSEEINQINEQLKEQIASASAWKEQEIESKKAVQLSQEELQRLQTTAETTAAVQKELANQAFVSYCETLEHAYAQEDVKYQLKIDDLKKNLECEQQKLNEMSATKAAAHQALLKEQEVKENKDNYRLLPSSTDLDDIKELEKVRRILHKPRVLSMLIWQTYWQPLAKIRFPQILQDKTKIGVYKITNTKTDECYIGQSVDVYKRWSEHCKCGLGIDTPPGNKLYKAIQDYGLENFTFELITECSKEELDSKEKYFIELYQAKEYGYNGTSGNK